MMKIDATEAETHFVAIIDNADPILRLFKRGEHYLVAADDAPVSFVELDLKQPALVGPESTLLRLVDGSCLSVSARSAHDLYKHVKYPVKIHDHCRDLIAFLMAAALDDRTTNLYIPENAT